MNGQIISFLATVIFMLMMVPAASDAGFNYKPPNLTFKDDQGTVVGSFSHDFHLQIYKCNDCHIKLFPFGKGKRMSMADMDAGKSCGSCHNGKTAFASSGDCNKCHAGLKPGNVIFNISQSTLKGYFSHDIHLQIYKCDDCHIKLFPFGKGKRLSMADMDAGKSCGACHNGKIAFATKLTCAKCHRKK